MNDAALGLFIEDVHTGHIECNLDVVARTGGGAGRNTCDQIGLLTYLEVEVDLGAHKLGNINISIGDAVGMCGELHGRVVNALGTETDDDFFADVVLEVGVVRLFGGQLEGLVLKVEVHIGALLDELTVDEVHLRSADEAGNEEVAGCIVKGLRSIDLLNETVLHNNDSRCHGHSLDLVVRNVNERGLNVLVQLRKLGSHRGTQLCVQVGQRLVKKEDLGLTDDSTPESDTLFLTAGQSLRLSVEQVGDVVDLSSLFNKLLDLVLRNLTELQTESHVVEYGHVRIQSV